MRTVKWNAFLRGLCGFAMALGVMAAGANADVTTERGSSVVVYPKVIATGAYDTFIQLTNISNDVVYVRCFYVNAQLFPDPYAPEVPGLNEPLWQVTDFELRLTRQQPTQWSVKKGRPLNVFDDTCAASSNPTCLGRCTNAPKDCNTNADCPAADTCDGRIDISGQGIDPGGIPPVVPGFVGELKCVEVDAAGTPLGGNHLKGEASIKGGLPFTTGNQRDVSKYNAIGIEGTQLVGATGNELQLNNRTGEENGMYNACPETTYINHFADGAENPVVLDALSGRRCEGALGTPCDDDGDCAGSCVRAGICADATTACQTSLDCGAAQCNANTCSTDTTKSCTTPADCPANICRVAGIYSELTVIPCTQDFENQNPEDYPVTVQFKVYNSFETVFSASTTIVCWKNVSLSTLGDSNAFQFATLGTTSAMTVMVPADDNGGVLAVLEEFHRDIAGNVARAAINVNTRGDRFFGEGGDQFDRLILSDQF